MADAVIDAQARIICKAAFNPYLERHAPERIQATRAQYAGEIVAVEEHMDVRR